MSNQTSPLYSILVLLLCIGTIVCEIEFYSPSELAGLKIKSNQFMFVGQKDKLNVTGRLILSDPSHGCSWNDIKNKELFENNIVLFLRDSGNPCSPVDKFKTAEKGKALAMVYLFQYDEYTALAGSKFFGAEGIHIGGVQAQAHVKDSKGYDLIVKYTKDENITVMISLHGDDPNIDMVYYIVFSILIGIFSSVNLGFALRKLYQFLQLNGKFKVGLPQACLTIEAAANFLRIILCLEPDVGVGRGVIDFGTVSFLQSGSLPWSFISTLVIAFYWDRSLRAFSSKKSPNWNIVSIQKLQIPLVIICVILVLGNLVGSAILAAFLADRTVAIIMFVYWGLCALGVGVYFTVTGIKVLRWAKSSKGNKSSSSSRTARLRRMTKLIVGTSAGLYWCVLALIVMTLSTESWFYGYIPLFLGLCFVSSMQILIFTPGSSVASGGTPSSGTHSKTGTTTGSTDKVELPESTVSSKETMSATTSADVLLSSA